jgi:hypothetical protein
MIAEHSAADTENHLAVPLHQSRECGLSDLTRAIGKRLEQFGIARLTGRAAVEKGVQMSQDFSRRHPRHETISPTLIGFHSGIYWLPSQRRVHLFRNNLPGW